MPLMACLCHGRTYFQERKTHETEGKCMKQKENEQSKKHRIKNSREQISFLFPSVKSKEESH